MLLDSFTLTNFLSFKTAELHLGQLTALVGPNASGKSNAVAAIRLLTELPLHGLPTAISRRGGFDQLRHRSKGRPFDPSLRLSWREDEQSPQSSYELKLGSIKGKRFRVKNENWTIRDEAGEAIALTNKEGTLSAWQITENGRRTPVDNHLPVVPEDQSAITAAFSYGGIAVWQTLMSLQTIDINPAAVGALQDPVAGTSFEADGSNIASVFESLSTERRREVTDLLASIVPGIVRVEPRHVADKVTLTFVQQVEGQAREFSAKQMSDGTLRAFGILLSLIQPRQPDLVVIEEPETAIHLGALRTLVGILSDFSTDLQIVITTHSAEMIDELAIDDLRLVWQDQHGESRIAPVAEHTRDTIREGLITPGELLKSDALDPQRT